MGRNRSRTNLGTRALTFLTQVAETGRPCPDNMAIAQVLDCTAGGASWAISELAKAGHINVIRRYNPRIIAVTATGKRTAGAEDSGSNVIPLPTRMVDREPCQRCGVRGDIGCACSTKVIGRRIAL